MAQLAPPVDPRTRAEVAAQLDAALAAQYPDWQQDGQGAAAALVEVLARYSELVIERINRVPDRNRLAFLSYLGGALLPPQPARVPLTFTLASGSVTAAVVPVGTQVSAAPAPGDKTPIVFETETELVVTATRLDQLFVRTPEDDRYADLSGVLTMRAENPVQVFTGDRQIEHSLSVGHSTFFGQQQLNELVLSFDIEEGRLQPRQVVSWEIWIGSQSIPLTPESDGTGGLAHSGDIVFRDLPVFPPATLAGREARWLRCRLLTPLGRPIIARSLTMEREVHQDGLLPANAFTNASKIDLSKDFFPFGALPRFGDAFYLSSERAFSLSEALVKLRIAATNPAIGEGDVPVPRVNAAGHAKVTWEYTDGAKWRELGTMNTDGTVKNSVTLFSDTTRAFTASGEVTFRIPPDMQPTEVGGIRAKWVRARLSANNYGDAAGYTLGESKPGVPQYIYKPATVVAPILKNIEMDFVLSETAQHPEFVLAYNDFAFQDVTDNLHRAMEAAAVFLPSVEPKPALYLGFKPPDDLGMPTLPVTIYFVFATGTHILPDGGDGDNALKRVSWQFWNGKEWVPFGVIDKTGAFSYSGSVTFISPPLAQEKEEFGMLRYWFRVPWLGGSTDRTSPLRLALLNTTSASQSVTLSNEILGSSNGAPNQIFSTARRPILDGEVLEVRSALSTGGNQGSASGKTPEAWTAWQNVPDFHASLAAGRHYILDRLAGQIRFGDGLQGAIPADGSANIRLTRYRTGGGSGGNKGVDTIIQLKTTVPYVRRVTNLEPASGGADAETLDLLLERAPKSFRHRSRAVTLEDYEDLAMLASPEVARARCVPLVNLLLDPAATQTRPGVVSVIIAPHGNWHKPLPSQELLSRVQAYLRERQCAVIDLVVLAPEYVEIDVTLEVGVCTLDGTAELELEIRKSVLQFIDPLNGGFDHAGWDFGRQPHCSDLHSLVGSIAGVDHLRTLHLNHREDRPGAATTDRFLACPGVIEITFTVIKRV